MSWLYTTLVSEREVFHLNTKAEIMGQSLKVFHFNIIKKTTKLDFLLDWNNEQRYPSFLKKKESTSFICISFIYCSKLETEVSVG